LLERLTANAKVAGFDPGILRHSGIWGAADEAVSNKVQYKKFPYLTVDLVLFKHWNVNFVWILVPC
jgi:hypothetical protein